MAFETVHEDYVNDAIELPPAADLVAMLDQGETYDSLAETFGCHRHTIQLRVRRSGLRDVAPELEVVPDAAEAALPLLGLGRMPDWYDRSLCAQTDPEAFYPEKGGETRSAKAICAVCPVQAECLDYALANDERHGVWGGLSERERRKVKQALQEEAGIDEKPSNTSGRHNARKTHCVNGHALTPDNTYTRPSGGRTCRICNRKSARRHRLNNQESA